MTDATRLIIKLVDLPQGKTLMLHGEDGKPLPGQVCTELKQQVGTRSLFTVTFGVNGDEIRID